MPDDLNDACGDVAEKPAITDDGYLLPQHRDALNRCCKAVIATLPPRRGRVLLALTAATIDDGRLTASFTHADIAHYLGVRDLDAISKELRALADKDGLIAYQPGDTVGGVRVPSRVTLLPPATWTQYIGHGHWGSRERPGYVRRSRPSADDRRRSKARRPVGEASVPSGTPGSEQPPGVPGTPRGQTNRTPRGRNDRHPGVETTGTPGSERPAPRGQNDPTHSSTSSTSSDNHSEEKQSRASAPATAAACRPPGAAAEKAPERWAGADALAAEKVSDLAASEVLRRLKEAITRQGQTLSAIDEARLPPHIRLVLESAIEQEAICPGGVALAAAAYWWADAGGGRWYASISETIPSRIWSHVVHLPSGSDWIGVGMALGAASARQRALRDGSLTPKQVREQATRDGIAEYERARRGA